MFRLSRSGSRGSNLIKEAQTTLSGDTKLAVYTVTDQWITVIPAVKEGHEIHWYLEQRKCENSHKPNMFISIVYRGKGNTRCRWSQGELSWSNAKANLFEYLFIHVGSRVYALLLAVQILIENSFCCFNLNSSLRVLTHISMVIIW